MKKRWLSLLLIVLILGVYSGWTALRPLPRIRPHLLSLPSQSTTSKLVWPSAGQAAVGVVGSSALDVHGSQTPVPTASTAKIITALVILEQEPLQLGQTGPTLTMGPSDVTLYNAYNSQGGSVLPVVAGEHLSEYQALQALLLPSANNIADSLAVWKFGSLTNYALGANAWLQAHGLKQTHVGSDASGLAPTTTSTAHDMVVLGELAMQNPVLAQIVGQQTAGGFPVVGTIKNVNLLLGAYGVIGIKTGNSDQQKGAFVSASQVKIAGQTRTIITALMGDTSLFAAQHNSVPLIQSAQTNFQTVTVVKAGSTIGTYKLPWGGSIAAVSRQDLTATIWCGQSISPHAELQTLDPNKSVSAIGRLNTSDSQISVPVALSSSPSKPSFIWRLTHP